MDLTARKITSYALSILVLVCTFIALLAIWDIIDLEEVMRKILFSLIVVFLSSVVTLFIFKVVLKDDDQKPLGE
jgi:glucan phosphoethanolaminetransferase (alkaline phosphatase superfamily)